jgi:hypothetical protein
MMLLPLTGKSAWSSARAELIRVIPSRADRARDHGRSADPSGAQPLPCYDRRVHRVRRVSFSVTWAATVRSLAVCAARDDRCEPWS